MELHQIADNAGARKSRIRKGRGIGSGKGKTCARGHKGQKSRSGVAVKGFEGGQMPIYRRLPKRGFNNIGRVENQPVNIGQLQQAVDAKKLDAKAIDAKALQAAGLIRDAEAPVKLLAQGECTTKLSITVTKASKSAQDAVKKAGGSVTLLAKRADKADA